MKKRVFIIGFIAMMIGLTSLSAQVGINTDEPGATLDVKATTPGTTKDGIIAPRMWMESDTFL